MQDLDLVSLVCSRLCHDLVSPVGAFTNGVELLQDEDDPEMRKQAFDLLGHSAELAARRLKFFRLAFGAAGGEAVPIRLRDARSATADFLADTRVELDWPDNAAGDDLAVGKTGAKLLLNLALLAAEAMPRGGTLAVDLAPGGRGTLATVSAAGRGAHLSDAAMVALLRAEIAPDLQPKAAPALLAARLAQACESTVRYTPGEDSFVLAAELPEPKSR